MNSTMKNFKKSEPGSSHQSEMRTTANFGNKPPVSQSPAFTPEPGWLPDLESWEMNGNEKPISDLYSNLSVPREEPISLIPSLSIPFKPSSK